MQVILQLKTKCTLRPTKAESDMILFSFQVGPIRVFCIANIPGENEREGTVYVKLSLHESTLVDVLSKRTDTWNPDPTPAPID